MPQNNLQFKEFEHVSKRLDTKIEFWPLSTKTFALQMKMIDPSLLTAEEVDYLNNYHDRCRQEVGPLLREMNLTDGLSWLIKETEPLG